MASGRSTTRPGSGPGRGKPAARTRSRTPPATNRASAPAAPVAGAASGGAATAAAKSRRGRPSFTARAIALAVVLLVLTISYATSLRIYFAQAHEIASTKAEIAERQTRIGQLQADVARWGDLDYVRTQARDRLGWVVPGETGYRVVGADGKPLGGGAEISAETAPAEKPKDAWWAKAWGSVEAADKPAPVKAKPQEPKPITPDSKPNNSTPAPTPAPTSTPR